MASPAKPKVVFDRRVRDPQALKLDDLVSGVATNYPQYMNPDITIVFDTYDKRSGSDPNGEYFDASKEAVVYRANRVEEIEADITQTLMHELMHARVHDNADSKLGRDYVMSEGPGNFQDRQRIHYGDTEESKTKGAEFFKYAQELTLPSLSIGGSSELVASLVPAIDQLERDPNAKGFVVNQVRKLKNKFPDETRALYLATRFPEDPTPTHLDISPSWLTQIQAKISGENPFVAQANKLRIALTPKK